MMEEILEKNNVRILQVVTHMNRGGLETMLMNYYRKIDREKVEFDFLVHRQATAAYDGEIEVLGGKIFRLPRLNPFSVTYKRKLKKFFKEHSEYRVIHVHQDCMSAVVLKEAKKCGVPVRIAHSHSSSQDKDLKYPIKRFFRKQISKYATHMFACGKEAGEWMFCGAEFEVLNNAIDASQYIYNEEIREQKRKQLGILRDELVVGHVGRFCYPKNHSLLIDIFEELTKRVPCKLLLVGDGELRQDIEEKVTAKNLNDRVIFTGVRSDVSDLMQAMDVFVFPSNYEGLPVTMIEAQAAGLPCLISDKVPIECKKTDLVQQISLEYSEKIWADKVLEIVGNVRRNTYEEIKMAGFDISENATKLQEFYYKVNTGENAWLH